MLIQALIYDPNLSIYRRNFCPTTESNQKKWQESAIIGQLNLKLNKCCILAFKTSQSARIIAII